MADDLTDQWQLSEPQDDDPYANLTISLPGDVKKGTKRKAFSDGIQAKKSKESSQSISTDKSKKKRVRRKITDESEEVLSKAGTPGEVRVMMTKALKDRMSMDTLAEILPDPKSDFYPSNTNSLLPSEYLTSIIPNWNALVKKSIHAGKNGSPCVLVITSSAIRAVNLRRELQDFTGEKCKIAKLFSKHIKVEEQKRFLSKTNCQLGIGTPNRLITLIKLGVLQTESLEAVVLDWNWRDTKMKRLPDIPEIKQDLTLLLKEYLMEVVQGSPCRLALL